MAYFSKGRKGDEDGGNWTRNTRNRNRDYQSQGRSGWSADRSQGRSGWSADRSQGRSGWSADQSQGRHNWSADRGNQSQGRHGWSADESQGRHNWSADRGDQSQGRHGWSADREDQSQGRRGWSADRGDQMQGRSGWSADRGDQSQGRYGWSADQSQGRHGWSADRGDQSQGRHGWSADRGDQMQGRSGWSADDTQGRHGWSAEGSVGASRGSGGARGRWRRGQHLRQDRDSDFWLQKRSGVPPDIAETSFERPPPGLKGRALGLWYRDRQRIKALPPPPSDLSGARLALWYREQLDQRKKKEHIIKMDEIVSNPDLEDRIRVFLDENSVAPSVGDSGTVSMFDTSATEAIPTVSWWDDSNSPSPTLDSDLLTMNHCSKPGGLAAETSTVSRVNNPPSSETGGDIRLVGSPCLSAAPLVPGSGSSAAAEETDSGLLASDVYVPTFGDVHERNIGVGQEPVFPQVVSSDVSHENLLAEAAMQGICSDIDEEDDVFFCDRVEPSDIICDGGDAVALLDERVALRYQHLKDNTFRREFMANLLGNQERDWTKLRYDASRQGLPRNPDVDMDLLKPLKCASAIALQKFRAELPAAALRSQILQLLADHQVLVISGETGCGKTTQVVQYILDEAGARGDGSLCHVVCTQPRRISAVSVAERVARERGVNIDQTRRSQVGYSIRLDHKQSRDCGSILFCTTGVLLQRLQTDPVMSRVSHLVIDEVHERDALCDFLLILVKDLLAIRRDLKVILMSATINAEQFSVYFHDCPRVVIPGRAFPVEALYLEDVLQQTGFRYRADGRKSRDWKPKTADNPEFQKSLMQYVRELGDEGKYDGHVLDSLMCDASEQFDPALITELIRHICQTEPPHGAILVFLTGWDEIGKLHKCLSTDSWLGRSSEFLILPLHSMMPTVDQKSVFDRPPPGCRKIVIATNIAETSITIDDIVFVIDGGRIKLKGIDSSSGQLSGCVTLRPEWVSRANSRQRRGRAGRVQAGRCYHLYSRVRESHLQEYPVPELLRTGLEELCLQVKILRLGRVEPFLSKAMNAPSSHSVQRSLQMLRRLGALDGNELLTPLGFHLAQLPMDPQTGKMIIMGAIFSCLDPVLSMAACLSFKDPFYIPLGDEKAVDRMRKILSDGVCSDHLTLAKTFDGWRRAANKQQFAYKHYLSTSTLHLIRNMRTQFMTHLVRFGFVGSESADDPAVNVNSNHVSVLRAVVCSGLYPNVAFIRRNTKRPQVSDSAGPLNVHLKSVNSDVGALPANWLVYKLKMKSTSVSIHDCSAVSPSQLAMFGERLHALQKQDKCILHVDGFVQFKCHPSTADVIRRLRSEFDFVLERRISDPAPTDWNRESHDVSVLRLVKELVTSDDIPLMDSQPNCSKRQFGRSNGHQ